MFRETLLYLKEGIVNFHNTGSLCATSKWAAKALASPIKNTSRPLNVLEVGAGTGSVTNAILNDLEKGDTLVICEINPKFMSILQSKMEENPLFQEKSESISFFNGPIQELKEDKKFDVIICSLPFLNFDVKTVKEIFNKLKRVSTNKTVMTYYEYIGLRDISKLISLKQRKQRMSEIDSFMKEHHKTNKIGHEKIWLNFLPINIYKMRV